MNILVDKRKYTPINPNTEIIFTIGTEQLKLKEWISMSNQKYNKKCVVDKNYCRFEEVSSILHVQTLRELHQIKRDRCLDKIKVYLIHDISKIVLDYLHF